MQSFIQDIIPVITTLFISVVFLTYLFIRTPSSFKIKFIGIPILLMTSIISIQSMESILGKSTWGYPEGKFTVIAFVVVKEPAVSIIEVWLRKKGETRLYKFPYSKKLEGDLKTVLEEQASGKPMIGKFNKNKGKQDGGNAGSFEFTQVIPHKLITKPPLTNQP